MHATVKNIGISVPVSFSASCANSKMNTDERAGPLYWHRSSAAGLGALDGTPLGDAAMGRAEADINGAWAESSLAKATGRKARKPRSFAEQPVHQPRPRGRPRKDAATALADARLHLGEEPAGTA